VSCPAYPDLSLGEWSQELLQRLAGRRYPFNGTFELTERCNLACVQCYVNRPAGSRSAQARELATLQVTTILDQAAEAGCLYLLLTGGEALLRNDFPELYRHARQRGMLVTLFTNGTLLTPRIADLLAEWPPRGIEISLYGRTQQTYERVTQVPGSYARCMAGIELALDRGLRLSLKTALLTLNHHELEAMQAFAQVLGVDFRFDPELWPRYDGGDRPYAYRLPAADIAGLDRDDPKRMQQWLETYRQFGDRQLRSDLVYGCGAGHHGFHIDSSGRLSMCMMARQPAYDLRAGTFQAGWESFLGPLARQKRKLDTPCRTCTIGVVCTQCPGWSQAVHGDDETPVEFVCDLGRLRAADIRRATLLPEPVAGAVS
jgi:radical SAM protein with 4Fe4S-binding SPASM domain